VQACWFCGYLVTYQLYHSIVAISPAVWLYLLCLVLLRVLCHMPTGMRQQ